MKEQRADFELLRAFARVGDQRALAEAIRRHLDLVYATALRKVNDAGAAEEISQNVFCTLARKAWRFAPDDSLPAWLHKTALLESKAWLRSELRRRRREQTAVERGTTMKTPELPSAFGSLVPLLDEALLSLRERDRTALLLRYYEGWSLREVGASFGVTEDAAQKRVAHALEKLSAFFQRRGFKTVTLAAAAAALNQTAVAAPAPTAPRVTRAASKTAAPTFASLLAFLALFTSLTRVQRATSIISLVTVTGLWLWVDNQRGEKADAQSRTVETGAANIPLPDERTLQAPARISGLSLPPEQVAEPPRRYVEIRGEVEFTSTPGSETLQTVRPESLRKFSFACVTATKEWWIQHDFTRGGETKWHFDGSNVYQSIRTAEEETEATRDQLAWTVPFEQAKTNLGIHIWPSLDGHPLGDIAVNIPWLAFCSGTYLKREGRLIPLPAAILRHTRDRFAYSDRTETFSDELGLPRAIDLFTSQTLYEVSNDDFDREYLSDGLLLEHVKHVASGLQEGVLTFHYAVTEWTNFFGWTLPTRFEFFQEGRKYEQNGDWFCRGSGRVESIRESTNQGNLFVPSLQQNIVDWRFRDPSSKVNALIYTSTNAFISATNDPVLQEKFAKRIARMKRGP